MVCFIVGAILSASAGWFGMKIATVSNVKTTEAAKTGHFFPGFSFSFSFSFPE